MNRHLNLFRTYAKDNRRYQLENDLTRALAICLQEDSLFFHELLTATLGTPFLNELFSDLDSTNEISINIQKNSNEVAEFERIIAVSLSECEMTAENFWAQRHEAIYDPICDIVIEIDNIAIVIEAKRDNVDCTSQLYNQVFNICKRNDIPFNKMKAIVEPVDLNWIKIMEIAVKVYSFEKTTGSQNRFLKDFIDLVKAHNFRWLPESSILFLSPDNKAAISRRIDSALIELVKTKPYRKLDYNDRMSVSFDRPWAREILYEVNPNGDLIIAIYPGNTKMEGKYIFQNDPELKEFIELEGKQYPIDVTYHIKFTSFQKYFTGLWFGGNDMKEDLYTKENFWKYSGRKRRENDWEEISFLFDRSFRDTFNWRKQCGWETMIINSGKNQFDLSFGYELSITVPFKDLQAKDQSKSDLTGLTRFLDRIYNEYGMIYTHDTTRT